MTAKEYKITVSVNIPYELVIKIDKIAEQEKVDRSAVINRLLTNCLEKKAGK